MSNKKEFKFFVQLYHETFEQVWEMHTERSRAGSISDLPQDVLFSAVREYYGKFLEKRGAKNESTN